MVRGERRHRALACRDALGEARVQRDAPLAPVTTFKVGGRADWLVQARSREDISRALEIARAFGLPVTVLGGGSNVLIADAGLRGLVIRMHGGEVMRLDSRHIRADGGVTINGLVRWTISHGVAGLEAWAGTPGTVGGAIHGNAHFRGRLISELIERVTLATLDGRIMDVPVADDGVRLRLQPAAPDARGGDLGRLSRHRRQSLTNCARSLASRWPFASAPSRSSRPAPAAFSRIPDPARDVVPEGIPWSAGALVDRAGLKAARAGRARVSTTHANFIVNEGGASAGDIRDLVERCKRDVRSRFGVGLREEIVYLGFERDSGDERQGS